MRNVPFHLLERLQCLKAKHIIVPSNATADSLVTQGVDMEKISVIGHGVDREVFIRDLHLREWIRAAYDLENCLVVINVGQMTKRKNQVAIVRLMQRIPNSVLILVGKGSEEQKVLSFAKNGQVRVLHFRHVSEPLLVALYNAADVYVSTSMTEGFGQTVLEGMACGLPVVAYQTGDFVEMIGRAGFVFDSKDEVAMVTALLELMRNESLRQLYSDRATLQAQLYSWDNAVDNHIRVFKNVVSARS